MSAPSFNPHTPCQLCTPGGRGLTQHRHQTVCTHRHTGKHKCTHTYTCVHTHICAQTHAYMCTHGRVRAETCTHVQTCTCVYTQAFMCTCVHMLTVHTSTHMLTCIHCAFWGQMNGESPWGTEPLSSLICAAATWRVSSAQLRAQSWQACEVKGEVTWASSPSKWSKL